MRPPLPYEYMPPVPGFVVESDDIAAHVRPAPATPATTTGYPRTRLPVDDDATPAVVGFHTMLHTIARGLLIPVWGH